MTSKTFPMRQRPQVAGYPGMADPRLPAVECVGARILRVR